MNPKFCFIIIIIIIIWRFLWFFQKISENLNYYDFFINLKFPTL